MPDTDERIAALEKALAELSDACDVLANRLDQQRDINLRLMQRLDVLESTNQRGNTP